RGPAPSRRLAFRVWKPLKRRLSRRQRASPPATRCPSAREKRWRRTEDARHEIPDGHRPGADGEDRFDARIGLLGVIRQLIVGAADAPDDAREGWMLGQSARLTLPASAVQCSARIGAPVLV